MVLPTLFFPVNSRWLSLVDGSVKEFLSNCRGGGGEGGGRNIIQFRSAILVVSFDSMYFFLFQSLDVRASENFSAS